MLSIMHRMNTSDKHPSKQADNIICCFAVNLFKYPHATNYQYIMWFDKVSEKMRMVTINRRTV